MILYSGNISNSYTCEIKVISDIQNSKKKKIASLPVLFFASS